MISKKKIENVMPFNGTWYIDCFHHAIFSMLPHFGRTNNLFLVEDIYLYKFEKEKNSLNVVNLNQKATLDIVSDLGIACDKKLTSNNIVEDIIASLSNNRPVIIGVDCYYLPIRPDTYMKEHIGHTLLFYGFDREKEEFNIIEHNYVNSYCYEERTLSFLDTTNAFNGLINELLAKIKHENEPVFFEFYEKETNNNLNGDKDLDFYISSFRDIMFENKTIIYDGLSGLAEYLTKFSATVANKEQLKDKLDQIMTIINKVTNYKKIEGYRIARFFDGRLDLIDMVNSVINDWVLIRAILRKYQLTEEYDEISMELAISKINSIHSKELNYFEFLYNKVLEVNVCV